jgi:hypothetical protein
MIVTMLWNGFEEHFSVAHFRRFLGLGGDNGILNMVFFGFLKHSEENDFSKITGKLSCMRSADLGTEANVTLTWKRYYQHGMDWRVEVVAIKEIWPFEELVRPNSDFIRSHL